MTEQYQSLGFFVFLLVGMNVLQRRLHFEAQAILLLITHRQDLSLALFSLLFFPGVLLHETSHYLMARVIGVQTGRFSLIPQLLPDGRLQLGYVETIPTDIFRDALIGCAPLLAGGVFVAYAGINQLGLQLLWPDFTTVSFKNILESLTLLVNQPDFWLWFYLTIVVSSTMFPSASDKRAWLPVFIFLLVGLGLGILAGAGPWMIEHLSPLIERAGVAMAFVLAISTVVHVVLIPPLWLIRKSLTRILNIEVNLG